MSSSSWFSEEDLRRIEAAVNASETGTSGEIVPVFVEQAGVYPEVAPKSALMGAFASLIGFLIWDLFMPGWGTHDPAWIALVLLLGSSLFWIMAMILPGFRRFLIGKEARSRHAFLRSDQWFLKEEVFKTRQRTGIMIFVARFEHKVIIKADKGISQLVAQEEWQHIVNDLVVAIKANNQAIGMINAIEACANLLRAKGIEALPDDTDELSNKLRME